MKKIEETPLTGCFDVLELLNYDAEDKPYCRSFTLCKTLVIEGLDRETSNNWVYMLIIEDDKFPIIISEDCAKKILADPIKGGNLLFNRFFDRYR